MRKSKISNSQVINTIRFEAVTQTFRNSLGKRTLILTAEFPYMIIGTIVKVESDYVFIDVETTNIDQFENQIIRSHIDRIMVFFIETQTHSIPFIRDFGSCRNEVDLDG